jgi:hypothetical protein
MRGLVAARGACRHLRNSGRVPDRNDRRHNCERDTNVVIDNSRLFYVHSTGGIPPADLYFYDLRFGYAHFQADGCSPGELGAALASKLTQRQRNFLIHNLSSNLATAFTAALRAR